MTHSGTPATAHQACDRCGTFATEFVADRGKSYCAPCAERVAAETRSPPSARWIVAAIVAGCLPVELWLVLNLLRPDILAPMLDHPFGFVVTLAEVVLTFLGLATYVFLVTVRPGSPELRVAVAIGAGLFFTLPALFLELFAPIYFAFIYGNLPAQ